MHRTHRSFAFRLNDPLAPDIPLRVRSTGRYDVPQGWSEPLNKKWFVELTWIVEGEADVLTDGKYLRVKQGDLHVYRPEQTHQIKAVSKRLVFCWMTLDHPEALQWVKGFGLQTINATRRPCPEDLFIQAAKAINLSAGEGERDAANFAHQILLLATAKTPEIAAHEGLAAKAKLLMEGNFNNPQFDLADLSSQLGVHRSTLFRRFNEAYHMKPSLYLLNLRLQHGLYLLQKTSLPVQELALRAGFSDPNYFSRTVRKTTGRTPSSFRNVKHPRKDLII